jgi:undecaprenyl-diphosphatase
MTDILLLSLVQGITEFLPVSSSAHLIILSFFTKSAPLSLELKLAFHLGTLGAIIIYFWRTLYQYVQGCLTFFIYRKNTPSFTEALFLVVATLPAIIVGYMIHRFGGFIEENAVSIGINSIIFGALLGIADKCSERNSRLSSYKTSFIIGIGQAIALLFPGASRSGSCITIGRFLKLTRKESIRFTFLLSIPTVVAAIALSWRGSNMWSTPQELQQMTQACFFSFIFGLLSIHMALKFLTNRRFTFFAFYRIFLGVGLLWYWLL